MTFQPGYGARHFPTPRPAYDARQPYSEYGEPAGDKYAGVPPPAHRGKRLLARLIDGFVWLPGALLLCIPLVVFIENAFPYGGTGAAVAGAGGTVLILFGSLFFYEGWQLAKWGRTLGKRIMGLRVVSSSPLGDRLHRGHAFRRAALYPVGLGLVGMIPLIGLVSLLNLLWQFWDKPLQQCLHDKMADTMVIDDWPQRG